MYKKGIYIDFDNIWASILDLVPIKFTTNETPYLMVKSSNSFSYKDWKMMENIAKELESSQNINKYYCIN